MGLNYTQMQVLIAKNRERKLLTGAGLACVANFLFAILLLPRYGVAGTCYALLGSEILYFVFLRNAIRRSL